MVKQATQEEVNSFTASEFLCLQGRFNPEKVGQANRKRIADIGAKFNSLPTGKQTRLIQYARENAGIEFEDDNFKIESDKDLKNLLFALDQRYYYADILDENRVANSVRLASES